MNNTFDIKRFWRYFVYDLNSAKNECGLTLLILGAMPVFLFFFYELFSVIVGKGFTAVNAGAKLPSVIIAFMIACLAFPAKHYGTLTERKAGSAWILLPASTLEKWLSMLLVTCVAVPVFMVAETAACEGLLGLFFKNTYGGMTIAPIAEGMNSAWGELSLEAGKSALLSWPYSLYLSWCATILVFTLGAICFRKSKVGKTFLALFLLGLALSIIAVAVVRIFGGADFSLSVEDITEESFVRYARIIQYAAYVVEFGLLDFFIYNRIRTIKQ